MIVYICEGCLARHMFTCEFCHGHKFLEECLDMASPESVTILAQLRARNFGCGSHDPIGETRNCSRQREQMAGKDSISSHEDPAIGEYRTNEESNLCTRPNPPGQQQQQLDSTDIEFHWNEDSDASKVRSQHIVLEEQLLDQVSKNENASSPEIQNVWTKTQTSRPTVIVCHKSEDTNQHIPSDQKQLVGHFGQNRTAINTPSARIQNTCCETQTSLAQDNAVEISSNVNYGEDSTSCFGANPQRLRNHHDQPSNTKQNKEFSIERILGKQTTAESSRIESRDGQIVFSSTSSYRFRLPQSVPENVIIDHDARDARNRDTHFSAKLFGKRGNPFHLQQGGHSSKKRKMESSENRSAVHASLAERSATPATYPRFEGKKCTGNFTNENSVTDHMEAHETQNIFKCNQCPREFREESHLILHYDVHAQKWPFKCPFCDFGTGIWRVMLWHTRITHASQFSSGELKCDKCLKQFIKSSKRTYGQNAFKCDLCSGEFNCKHELAYHYRTDHEGEKRFKCNVCGYATAFRQNLTMHQNTVH